MAFLGSLLFGCGAKKYKVDYSGDKDDYRGAKEEYRAGEKVTLYFDLIATDTDYKFLLDGEALNPDFDYKTGFKIQFTMPDHDVKLECIMKNTMMMQVEPDILIVDYYTAVVGTDGYDHHKEYALYSYDADLCRLSVYTKPSPEEEETEDVYYVPYEVFDRCMEVIYEENLQSWVDLTDGMAIDGGVTAVKFLDGRDYIRCATDNMPEDGERSLDKVGAVLRAYEKPEYWKETRAAAH